MFSWGENLQPLTVFSSQAGGPHPSASVLRLKQTAQLSCKSPLPQVKHVVVTWCCMTRLASASLRTLLLACPSSLLLKRMWQRGISVEWIFNAPSPDLFLFLGRICFAHPCSLPVTGPLRRSMESSRWSNNFPFSQGSSGGETSWSSSLF